MHRALLLPEIVANILEIGETEPGFLFNCLTVNKTFFDEASRKLWVACASNTYGTPEYAEIRTLANIVLQDDAGHARAQIYANHIQTLDFKYEDDDFEKTDARWHPVLAKLQFPKLRSLSIYPSNTAKSFNTGDALLAYAQPSLQFFNVYCATKLSNGFLERLGSQCPGLQELHLDSDDSTVSSDDLVNFLSKASSLEQLNLRTGDNKIWSPAAFAQLSQCSNLVSFNIPELIEEGWLASLGPSSGSEPFPDLLHVSASMTTDAVKRLSVLQPKITSLRMYNEKFGPTQDMLAAASCFQQLECFAFYPSSGSLITGQEIIQLAQACPSLEELSIGDGEATPAPGATGITDDAIRSLAEGLPKLQTLQLVFNSNTRPSIGATLTSLGRHCPELTHLTISCQRDWESILSVPEDIRLPLLEGIDVYQSTEPTRETTADERMSAIERWTTHVETWFPLLDCLEIEGGSLGWELAFKDVFEDQLEGTISTEEEDEGVTYDSSDELDLGIPGRTEDA
jgi:hypothetical protein